MIERAYGWRPSPPDHRDELFGVHPRILRAMPSKVDLSQPGLAAPFEPIWGQGKLGSCGPHAAAADIVFAALKQQSLPAVPMPSRLFIYFCARSVMNSIREDSGVDNRSMLKALAKFGWCDEERWPYSQDFRSQPRQDCFDQAAGRKIDKYLSVPQVLDQMKGCLAGGDPFIFGFTVYQSFETDTVDRTGIVPMPSRRERAVGGHDVLIVGYDDAMGKFKFRNSYTPKWGQNGYGWIPYDYALHPQLAGDFWTVRHSALPDLAPVNPPPVPPSPSPNPPAPAEGSILTIMLKGKIDEIHIPGFRVSKL